MRLKREIGLHGHSWYGDGCFSIRMCLDRLKALILGFISLMYSLTTSFQKHVVTVAERRSQSLLYWIAQFQHQSYCCGWVLEDRTILFSYNTGWLNKQHCRFNTMAMLAPGFTITQVYSKSFRTNRAWGQATSKRLTTSSQLSPSFDGWHGSQWLADRV